MCCGASSVFLTLRMRNCTKLFFLYHVSSLQTLPIRLIGRICAAKKFMSTPHQPCGGNALEAQFFGISVQEYQGVQEFRFFKSWWGTCELSNMWKQNRTICSLGLLWIGQEVFCLKLIEGSLAFYQDILSHDLVGKQWNWLRRRVGVPSAGGCGSRMDPEKQRGKGMSWCMWYQPGQALQSPWLMVEHWGALEWQRMEWAVLSPGDF